MIGSFYQESKYPAFHFKSAGVQNETFEKSAEEEIALTLRLAKDGSIQQYQHSSSNSDIKYYLFNSQVTSVLQGFKRPMCGLVVLHMAAQMLRRQCISIPQISLEVIFSKAVEANFSKQGEMFSAYEMAKLATTLYNCTAQVFEGNLYGNQLEILKHLLHGNPVLIPYDNDKNFEPCLRNGHKAHWALATGAVVGSPSCLFEKEGAEAISEIPNAYKIKEKHFKTFYECLEAQPKNSFFVYVFTKQGKSAKNRLWSLKSLSDSNSNLNERDPSREWNLYHCPCKLSETLKNRCVVLS